MPASRGRLRAMTIATLRDRLVAADPGFVRMYIGLRATATVGTALGILLLGRYYLHYSLRVALVGAAIGIMWTLMVNDERPRDQRITTLALWFPAASSIAIATLTVSSHVLSDALFVVTLFLSQYVRRYGPRMTAMGGIAVLSFFFALFLQATLGDLPYLLLALAVTALCTYVYRFYIFRDNPALALHNALAAFRARQGLIAEAIAQAAQRGRIAAKDRRALQHHMLRLNETALMIDDLLIDSDDRASVLEAELATGELVERAMQGRLHAPIELQTPQVHGPIRQSVTWSPRGPFRTGTNVDTGRIRATTRQAIQITVAGALSIVIGELLSPQRWYWAVLAAFLVFIGTSSAYETMSRAWSRLVGTALGVFAGMGVGFLVNGHDTLAFCLLLVCLFGAVYTFRLSPGIMMFFITVALAMLYVLLGFFTEQVLMLRLVEVAVGVTLGALAALFILPIRSSRVLLNVTVEALQRLDDLVETAVERLSGNAGADPLAAARKYDETLQSLRTQVEPLIIGPRFAFNSVLRLRLTLMAACGYYGRALASLSYEAPQDCPIDALRKERDSIAEDIRYIIALRENGARDALLLPHHEFEPSEDGHALNYLERIERTLHGLERSFSMPW